MKYIILSINIDKKEQNICILESKTGVTAKTSDVTDCFSSMNKSY